MGLIQTRVLCRLKYLKLNLVYWFIWPLFHVLTSFFKVARKGGDLNTTLYVDYRTSDGTANAGSDYEAVEATLRFDPGETMKNLYVKILDDDIFEEDEYFSVELFNVRSGSADGMFDTDIHSATIARLEAPSVAHVIILDDDHAGVFTFATDSITVKIKFLL